MPLNKRFLHTHTYIHTYIHACMHACIDIYIQIYKNTQIHTYIHTCIIRFLNVEKDASEGRGERESVCIYKWGGGILPLLLNAENDASATGVMGRDSDCVCVCKCRGING